MMSFEQLTPAQQQQVVDAGAKRYPGAKVTAEMIAANGGLANQLMEIAGISMPGGTSDRQDMLNAMDWIGNDGMPTKPATDAPRTAVASAMKQQSVGKGDKQQVKGDDTATSAPLPPRRPDDLAGTQRTPQSPSETAASTPQGQETPVPPTRPRDLGTGVQPTPSTSAAPVDVAAVTDSAAGGDVNIPPSSTAPSDSSFSQIVSGALKKGKEIAGAAGGMARDAASAVGNTVSNAYTGTPTPPSEVGTKALAATMGALEQAGVDAKTLGTITQGGGDIMQKLLAFAKTAPPQIRKIIEQGMSSATAKPAAPPVVGPNMDIDTLTRMQLGNEGVQTAPDSGYIDEQM